MALKTEAVLILLKTIGGTMDAAGLSLTGPKKPGEDDADITFSGDAGDATLKLEGNILQTLCRKKDTDDFKCVSQTLFDCETEDWDIKDTKSAANEVSESVASFFGTAVVYETQENKANAKANTKSSKGKAQMTPEIENFIAQGQKKKAKRESTITYEPENLANRMENIFPAIKGSIDKNIEKYEMFLPEEYFRENVTDKIIEAIKLEDKPILKKVFNAFNIFYDEGGNDVQSLIVVSILGIALSKEDGLVEKCENYMSETLYDALIPVIKYLKTGAGKRKLADLENPKPYVSKRIKK